MCERTRAGDADPGGDDATAEPLPLELLPTIRTLKGYGRRVSALGTLKGLRLAEDLVAALGPFAERDPELAGVLARAMVRAQELRLESMAAAAGEQAEET